MLLQCLALLLLAVTALAVGPAARDPDGVYRGVNLGGWLVLESWLTPSLFRANGVKAGAGEWQFCEGVGGPERCQAVLEPHWDSWVTRDDIHSLAAAGLQYVRIPVGYWIVDRNSTEPYPAGGLHYLERVITWLKEEGMGAVIDLHGAPGSQNGHDNSGYSGPIRWNTPANINRTVKVLQTIASLAVGWEANKSMSGVVEGIETLNEPWTPAVNGPIQYSTLKAFYVRAYDAIRGAGFNGSVWVSDGFAGSAPWVGVLAPPQYQGVLLDSHLYHAFGGPTTNMTAWNIVRFVCSNDAPSVAARTDADWVVVGEWSNALTKNGPPDNATDVAVLGWARGLFSAQLQAWDGSFSGGPGRGSGPGKGSFFWNFKTETGLLGWDLLKLLRIGAVPPTLDTASFGRWEYTC